MVYCKNMGQQINAKLSHKKPDICEMSQTGNEISFLLFRNFPQEEIQETEFHLTSFFCVPTRKEIKERKWLKVLPLPNISIT